MFLFLFTQNSILDIRFYNFKISLIKKKKELKN